MIDVALGTIRLSPLRIDHHRATVRGRVLHVVAALRMADEASTGDSRFLYPFRCFRHIGDVAGMAGNASHCLRIDAALAVNRLFISGVAFTARRIQFIDVNGRAGVFHRIDFMVAMAVDTNRGFRIPFLDLIEVMRGEIIF